ncbi:MAG TPA: hypothetical protein VGH33_23255 [Isosphaeraceae bacterium]
MRFRLSLALALASLLAGPPGARAAFNPGDFYASFNLSGASVTTNIAHYGPTGAFIDTISVPGSASAETRGLAYGPDGLLYAVQSRGTDSLAVLALDSAGNVQQTYTASGPSAEIANGIYLGKIAFDNAGHFFVGTNGGLLEYNTGDASSGKLLYSGSNVNDVRAVGNCDIRS